MSVSTLTLDLDPTPLGSRPGANTDHPPPTTPHQDRTDAVESVSCTAASAFARITEAENYPAWLSHVTPAGACTRPIRLRGQLHTVHQATGEILTTRSTASMPDGVLYTRCGNRRTSVCPSCAETYRADTYQLIAAGLRGGKGVPDTVAEHSCVFATFSAPGFGPVHHRVEHHGQPQPCRPRRKPVTCPHGVDLRCHRTHHDGEACLGTPLCLDCYDHAHQVIFNAFAGELWRRTSQHIRRTLQAHAKHHGHRVRVSFAKVAEFQTRGAVHLHALFRLDGVDPQQPDELLPPPAGMDADTLATAIHDAAGFIAFTTPPHTDQPQGWRIEWGPQVDTRTVQLRGDGEITDTAVAGYLAKYATKATEATGHTSTRLSAATIDHHTDTTTHIGRMLAACWRLGRPGVTPPRDDDKEPPYKKLRRWAHMLGFGGHFSTRSRRYSTTLRALREARTTWRRQQHHRSAEHTTDDETTLVVGTLTYAGTGWHTLGDALLANTAAAKAREHRQIIGEELHTLQQPGASAA